MFHETQRGENGETSLTLARLLFVPLPGKANAVPRKRGRRKMACWQQKPRSLEGPVNAKPIQDVLRMKSPYQIATIGSRRTRKPAHAPASKLPKSRQPTKRQSLY